MKKIISIFIFIILLFSLFSIKINATKEKVDYILDDSGINFPIGENEYFNYLYTRKSDIDNLENKINDLIKDYQIRDYKLYIKYELLSDVYLNIRLEINNKKLELIEYLINEFMFIRIRDKKQEINNIDLRIYNDIFTFNKNNVSYNIETNISISNESIDYIYNDFIDKIGLSYINGIYIIERNGGAAYYVGTEPRAISLIKSARSNNSIYEDFESVGENDYDVFTHDPGRYLFIVHNLNDDGTFNIMNYLMCIYDNNSIICNEANISYKEFVNSKKYVNDYVGGYDDYFDKTKYRVATNYFSNYNIIGTYPVEIKYKYDDIEIIGRGIINVIDDIKPIIESKDIYYGKVSNLDISIKSIFNDVSAYDEIDKDITNRIKIIDVDKYEEKFGIEGEYNFILSVEDNFGNVATKNVKYILENDTKIEIDDNNEELNDENIDNEIKDDEIINNNEDEIDNNEDLNQIEENENTPINIIDNNETNENIASPIDNKEAIDEENNNEVDNIDDNNKKDEIIISGFIRTTIDKKLNLDELKNKLMFSGFIDDDFDGEIETDYFGNENNIGEYNIIIYDDEIKNVRIMVIENQNNGVEEPKNGNYIAIFSVVGFVIAGGGLLIFILIRHKKKNK